MKKLKLFCMASFAALMLGACSDDKFVDGPEAPATPGADEEGVYFTVNIAMPNGIGGRSVTTEPGDNGSTSNSGVEIGQDYENTISEAIVVLAQSTPDKAETNNGFIAAAPITSGDLVVANAEKTNYTAKSKFTKTALKAFYDKNSVVGPISANIFLFCNPTKQLRDALLTTPPTIGDTDWLNEVGNVDESSPIWTPNYFLMSNALIATRQIPGALEVWNNYTKEDKPFHLSQANPEAGIDNKQNGGAIKVERTAARFDFRDGSPLAETQPFTYHVVLDGANDATVENKTPLIDVTLQKMAMVNVDKSFYFLPHMIGATEQGVMKTVDPASLLAGVCQPEQPWYSDEFGKPITGDAFRGNYVLSPDYEWKKSVNNSTTSGFAANLLYPFFNENGVIDNNSISNDRWATSLCADVVNGTDNKTEEWNAPNKDYKIWRYATENTIPSIEGQVNGVTTGVVFKGKMVATTEALKSEDEAIKLMAQTINNVDGKLSNSYTDPILYLFDGNLYMTWENVQKAAIAAANPTFKFVPDEDFNTSNKGTWKIETINRTNSLYVAVFGTGGCGKLTFNYTVKEEINGVEETVTKTETIDDSLDPDPNCANAAWTAWATATPAKPESGALTDAFKAAVTGADFTIYQSSYDLNSGWGYYCYYYYWNHHNDNGNNGVMGPMELAVVRNNVYKLAVTKIKQLGHPRISANDPNRPTPGTPDESEDVYLDVQAEVLPWVVRVNNIEF